MITKRKGADNTEDFADYAGTLSLSFEEDTTPGSGSAAGVRDVIRIEPNAFTLSRTGRRLNLPVGGSKILSWLV